MTYIYLHLPSTLTYNLPPLTIYITVGPRQTVVYLPYTLTYNLPPPTNNHDIHLPPLTIYPDLQSTSTYHLRCSRTQTDSRPLTIYPDLQSTSTHQQSWHTSTSTYHLPWLTIYLHLPSTLTYNLPPLKIYPDLQSTSTYHLPWLTIYLHLPSTMTYNLPPLTIYPDLQSTSTYHLCRSRTQPDSPHTLWRSPAPVRCCRCQQDTWCPGQTPLGSSSLPDTRSLSPCQWGESCWLQTRTRSRHRTGLSVQSVLKTTKWCLLGQGVFSGAVLMGF